jgi:hypothetical protein
MQRARVSVNTTLRFARPKRVNLAQFNDERLLDLSIQTLPIGDCVSAADVDPAHCGSGCCDLPWRISSSSIGACDGFLHVQKTAKRKILGSRKSLQASRLAGANGWD